MSIIFFSLKLFKILRLPNIPHFANNAIDDIFGSWNSNVFYLKGKKFLLFTNKRTLYTLIIVDFSVGELEKLNSILYSTVVLQLKADNLYNSRRAELFKSHFSKLNLAPTDNDRPIIGSMNDYILQFKALYESGRPSAKHYENGIVATFLNETPMGKLNFASPIEELEKVFTEVGV